MSDFTHLHVHSHFSLLQAVPKIPELVEAAKADGQKALALTDAGNMYGAIQFYQECEKNEIKPILGVDAHVALRSRHDKQPGVDKGWHRLVLLVKNREGYKNLVKLVTDSFLEGFYYKPRIDYELIEKYHQDLVCISPSFSGDIAKALEHGDSEKARELIKWYTNLFGDDFYIEISRHPELSGHNEKMEQLVALARETNTPIVAAHDVYYLKPDDRRARETLLAVQSNNPNAQVGFDEEEEDFSFLSQDEMKKRFTDIPDAIENTQKIVEKCTLDLELGGWVFPEFETESGKPYDEELKDKAYAGFERRGMEQNQIAVDRLEYELKVIADKGYSVYFLIVGDLLREAHERGIHTTIRGSVAGSLTTYLLGITNVDPLAYKLPFERFLNPERPKAPDIDMDFADDRRDEILDYARERYGRDKVAQIGTFGTMMARGAVRDVARAMGFPYSKGDEISKLIPFGAQGFPMTIAKALEQEPDLKKLYQNDAETREILDMAQKIEGCARHISVHAAGVVISPKPLTDYTPLQYDPKGGKLITQFDMHEVEDAGLVKFDFLGIRNLAILSNAVRRVKKLYDVEIDIENIPLDDPKTFELVAKGETIGLFQLNGEQMTQYLKELKPSTIHDINAMVALYRPGPMESIPSYIERKHNPRKIKYLDERLKDILDQSYGVITYQDDVLMIAIKLGGYSWLEADKLRKAMGKKIPEEMEAQREKLTKGLLANGMDEKKAAKLWELIGPFAGYGFNKCVVGSTMITDARSGKRLTVDELYRSSRQPVVHTLNTKTLRQERKQITNVHRNGIKPVYRLTTRSGRTLTATRNHPLYTMEGWKDLGDLAQGDRVAVPRTLPVSSKTSVPEQKAAALGYLIAEGHLTHPHGVYFYAKEQAELQDFSANVRAFDNVSLTKSTKHGVGALYVGRSNRTQENRIFSWLRSIGAHGKTATKKRIPECVFTWDQKAQAVCLGKMWQGDGAVSITNEQLFYATSSYGLARDVQHLLLRFDILSTIHTKQFRYRGGYKQGYTIVVSHRDNIIRFFETVGKHLISAKQSALKTLAERAYDNRETQGVYYARGTSDTVPASVRTTVRQEMRVHGYTVQTVSKATGIAVRSFSYDARKKGFQRGLLATVAETLESKEVAKYAEADVYWDTVVSIEYAGTEMTYDLTVPVHHNFVANDIYVHNSHAASYGRVAYQTAYMKANYPAAFMSAVMTAESGDTDKIAATVAECTRMGLEVLPPDINESRGDFTVVRDTDTEEPRKTSDPRSEKIRFGLYTIKNVGEGIANAIIAERDRGGKFASLADFLTRVEDRNLNRRTLESLIKTGAFDNLGERGQMLANIDYLMKYHKEASNQPEGQDSLFGLLSDQSSVPKLTLEESNPADPQEKLSWEKELIGLYISGHPLDSFQDKLAEKKLSINDISTNGANKQTVVLGALIEDKKEIFTKKGDRMAFIKLGDYTGSIEAVAFPSVYEKLRATLEPDTCVVIKGTVTKRDGETSIAIDKAKRLGAENKQLEEEPGTAPASQET